MTRDEREIQHLRNTGVNLLDRAEKAKALVDDLENQIAELQAGMDQAKQDVDEMEEALAILISAARGMPISHDNLCQGTLDWAIDEAEKAISGDGSHINEAMEALDALDGKEPTP